MTRVTAPILRCDGYASISPKRRELSCLRMWRNVAMKDYLINQFSFPHIALCHGCGRRSTAGDPELCAVCYLTKQAAAQLTHDQLVILLENLTYLAYPPDPLTLAPYEKKR